MALQYTFQESRIWDPVNQVDGTRRPVTIKVKAGPNGEQRARRKLPDPGMGRIWLNVGNRNESLVLGLVGTRTMRVSQVIPALRSTVDRMTREGTLGTHEGTGGLSVYRIRE